MMWGGSDEPCALCQCVSLGAINLANNKTVCKAVCDLLSEVFALTLLMLCVHCLHLAMGTAELRKYTAVD